MVEPVSFNGKIPAIIATKTKKYFEDKVLRIPDDSEIRKDLHSVRRVYSESGAVRFEAPRTKDGHADRFWALGLAIQAMDGAYVKMEYHGMRRREWEGQGGCRDWKGY